MTSPARLLALLCLALCLTGCRLTLGVEMDLERDGGGTLAVQLRSDADLEAMAAEAGVDPLGRLAERVRAQDDGWQVADAVDGADGSRVVELTSGFADPAAFDVRWAALVTALDAPEARLLGPLSVVLEEDADTVAVTGSLPLVVNEVAAADAGVDVATLTAQLQEAVTTTLTVRTPGTPIRTDGAVEFADPAASEGPAEVTWTVAPGGEVPVSLVAERGGVDWLQYGLVGGGVVLALGMVAGGVMAQRRR